MTQRARCASDSDGIGAGLCALAEGASDDVALAATGLDASADALEAEDRR